MTIMEEYQQMLDELSKLDPRDLQLRLQFLDEWAQLDQLGRELLRDAINQPLGKEGDT